MIYGYIRCSTDHQNTQNQKFEIEKFAIAQNMHIDIWVEEVLSSKTELKKRKLYQLLHRLKKGDILISSELSRLGRNLLQVMSILHNCLDRECQVWTIKENYRLGADIQSKVLAFAFSLSAEIERNLISERTKESLKRVKAEGRHLGRPFGFRYQKLQKYSADVEKMLAREETKADIARTFGVSWITVHRFLRSKTLGKKENSKGPCF